MKFTDSQMSGLYHSFGSKEISRSTLQGDGKRRGVQLTLFKTTKSELVDGLVDGLVESQEMIVKLIAKKPKVSKRELAEKIGMSITEVR